MNEPRAAYVTPAPYIAVAIPKYTESGVYMERFQLGAEDAKILFNQLGVALIAAGVKV